ncbi:MAG: ABC transporter ATP-binding protein [Candidatus Uhrbacteria bacterium]|nr:ABC transporter ATP-binding protein [Patescibacteria group bacterium]MBU1906588.1 ABC transporter ATP-binding protein [Patescibacteria group bacterium]
MEGNNECLIEVKNLFKEFVNEEVVTKVLFDLNFKINCGEFAALMGPSGSGKSTLMHILGFLDHLTSGQYFFNGKDVSGFDEDELARLRRTEVGFVFQAFNLLSRATVLDNVLLPTIYTMSPIREREARARQVLEQVGLSHRLDHFSNQLSGGEKQRVSIARALINDPKIIFADEPTGNLDSVATIAILEILQRLNREGRTIIMVTHEPELTPYTKRVLKLLDGRLVSDQPMPYKDITREPPAAYARHVASQEQAEAEI